MLEKLHRKLRWYSDLLEQSLYAPSNIIYRVFVAILLFTVRVIIAAYEAIVILLVPPQHSFHHIHGLTPGSGYRRSYSAHRRLHRQLRFGTLSSLASVMAVIMVSFIVLQKQALATNFSVSCNSTALTESSYTSSDNLTLTDGGDGICTVDAALTVNTLTIQTGTTLNHVAENTTGVNVTAATLDIQSGGAINVNGKGCGGGPAAGANAAARNGEGPDASSGSCTVTTTGYGKGNRGGAAHGGAGGRENSSDTSQTSTYGSNSAPILLGSGGAGGPNSGETGGAGGGLIRLDVSGTLTVSGTISANGADGVSAAGGASGGSIYITAGTIAGNSTITAAGGAGVGGGAGSGGGGGGGRIAVYYDTLSVFAVTNITAAKGAKGTNATGAQTDGGIGSTFILNRKTDDGVGNLSITSGLDLVSGGDYTRTNITAYNGANITCASFSSLSVTATTTLDLQGVTWTCTSVDTITLTAATWTTSNTNTMDFSKSGAKVTWSITNDLTLNNLTYTGGAAGSSDADGGLLTLTNVIDVSLVNTDINSNTSWTTLESLTLDTNSTINANTKGCAGGTAAGTATTKKGWSPDTANSNICAQGAGGFGKVDRGGAAHGGAGGSGNNANTNQTTTYGSNTAPVLLGSGGGAGPNSGETGGAGGGKIRLDATGNIVVNGAISANGGAGLSAAGGASGGSVYITSFGTISGSANVTADGGNGISIGGGGGGGRVSISYSSDTRTGSTSAALGTKGTGTGWSQTDGSAGTTYTLQYTVPTTPTISSPSSGATNVSRGPTVTSAAYASNGASHTTTDWQISDDNTFADACNGDTNIVYCKLASTNKESIVINSTNGAFQNALSGKTKLAPSTVYYVRVRHTNGAGNSSWATAVSFTTAANTVPATPTNSTPTNNATGQSKNPTITASDFSDSDSDSHGSSDWLMYETSDCSGTADWSKTTDASNLTNIAVNSTNGTFADALSGRTTLRAHTTYSFKTRHTDAYSGNSNYSTCTSFTTTNTAPALDSNVAAQSLTEDTNVTGAFDLDTYFSDVDFNDDDQYTCTASNGFDSTLGTMTINTNRTIDFTLTANANGTDTIQFSCQDGGSLATSSNSITVTVAAVNDVPTISDVANQSVNEDTATSALAITLSDVETAVADLTMSGSSSNTTLIPNASIIFGGSGASRTVTLTPAANQSGSSTITLSVSDGTNTASDPVTFTVTAVNDTPTISDVANQTVNEDTATSALAVTVSDIETAVGSLTFTASSSNTTLVPTANISLGGSGASRTVTVTPAANESGTSTITLTVSDNALSATDTFVFTVTAVNDLPSAHAGTDQTKTEDDTSTTLDASASTDADGTLTYSWAEILDGSDACSISNTTSSKPTVTIANKDSNYSCEYRVTVSDSTVTATDTVVINVTANNDAPVIPTITDKTVNEDDTLTFAVSSTDVDTSIVTLSAQDNNGQFTKRGLNAAQLFTDNRNNTGTFSWKPGVSDSGGYVAAIQSADGTNTTTGLVNITVQNTLSETPDNSAPEFTNNLPNIGLIAGTTTKVVFNLNEYFTDPDDDVLTYTATGQKKITVNITAIGKVFITAPENFSGSEAVLFRADDPTGASVVSNPIVVTVNAPPAIEEIDHVVGDNEGGGRVFIVDKNNEVVVKWTAFETGGVIPRLANINDEGYVFAVKAKAGSTIRTFGVNTNLISTQRLSPKLHWRKLAIGQLTADADTTFAVIGSRRNNSIYLKVLRFNTETNHFDIVQRAYYHGVQNNNFRVTIDQTYVYLFNAADKQLLEWRPFASATD